MRLVVYLAICKKRTNSYWYFFGLVRIFCMPKHILVLIVKVFYLFFLLCFPLSFFKHSLILYAIYLWLILIIIIKKWWILNTIKYFVFQYKNRKPFLYFSKKRNWNKILWWRGASDDSVMTIIFNIIMIRKLRFSI